MRLRPTYANVVSTLALLLVVSGGAYAATQLPKDSVRSKQIKNNTVKSKDVKDGNLRATDLKAGEIDAEVAGTPMGGDLAGTFPNPTLDPLLRADLATDVEVETAVADLRDDVVIGKRASGSAFLLAGAGYVELVSIPDVVTVSALCFEAGPNQGMNVEVVNEAPVAGWDYVLRQQSQVPALTTIASDELAAGDNVDIAFAPDTNTQSARHLQLTVFSGTPLTIEVAGITSTVAGNCQARASVQVDDGPV